MILPSRLTAEQFASYPPEARAIAVQQLSIIRKLPLVFAAILLRELNEYDWQFPVERAELNAQFKYLGSLTDEDRNRLLLGFANLKLPSSIESLDWIRQSQQFMDALTAHLWSTGQIDEFRQAAAGYASAWRKLIPEPMPVAPRLSIVVLGKGLRAANYPLFRKLRTQGVFFPQVDPTGAWGAIRDQVSARAEKYPLPYGHWYIDGSLADPKADARLTRVSYEDLQPTRKAILERMQRAIASGGGGPEALRTSMDGMTPKELGLSLGDQGQVLSRFGLRVLTEGSGTQIFSTTFVQWTAREALRRAQPCTLLLRFAPRQRQLPMNEMLTPAGEQNAVDPEGSTIDADMGAYYTWINLQRLTGAKSASFLAWSEEHQQAIAIGPQMPRSTVAVSGLAMKQIFAQML